MYLCKNGSEIWQVTSSENHIIHIINVLWSNTFRMYYSTEQTMM